jgi:hypothetical protein
MSLAVQSAHTEVLVQFWFMQRTLPNGSCMLHVKWLQALKDVLSGANVSALVVMHEAGANWS